MLQKRRLWRNKSERGARRITVRQSIYGLRAGFNIFEDRRMLAGYFDDITTKVDAALGSIKKALHESPDSRRFLPTSEIRPESLTVLDFLRSSRYEDPFCQVG